MNRVRDESLDGKKKPARLGYRCSRSLAAQDLPMRDRPPAEPGAVP